MKKLTYLSWGFGWDSTALALMIANKVPALKEWWDCGIVCADPGNETDRTYEVMPYYMDYFEDKGLEVVKLVGKEILGDTLYDYFWKKNMVPLGWATPICSVTFKRDVIHNYYRQTHGTKNRSGKKALYATKVEITELIGFNLDDYKRINYNKRNNWLNRRYPLFEFGVTKAECKAYILKNGHPAPGKSSCWFCPNKSWNYFRQMDKKSLQKMIDMEENAKKYNPIDPPTFKGKPMAQLKDVTDKDIYADDMCSKYCHT